MKPDILRCVIRLRSVLPDTPVGETLHGAGCILIPRDIGYTIIQSWRRLSLVTQTRNSIH